MRKAVIATFARSADADSYIEALRSRLEVKPADIGIATVAAYREPHDGDRLVVVWVPTTSVETVNAMVEAHAGVVHATPGMTPHAA